MNEVTITKKLEISNEQINDLMVCALEGGINYWCSKAEITKRPTEEFTFASEVIALNGELTLKDAESDDTWVLTKDKFLKGLGKTVEWGDFKDVEELMDAHDAETADVLIQYAIFDEIEFG